MCLGIRSHLIRKNIATHTFVGNLTLIVSSNFGIVSSNFGMVSSNFETVRRILFIIHLFAEPFESFAVLAVDFAVLNLYNEVLRHL